MVFICWCADQCRAMEVATPSESARGRRTTGGAPDPVPLSQIPFSNAPDILFSKLEHQPDQIKNAPTVKVGTDLDG